MTLDPNLAGLKRQWAADDAERYLRRCGELQHEIAEAQAAYAHGVSPEKNAALRAELSLEHASQASAAEVALGRLRESGPAVGTDFTIRALEGQADHIRAEREELEEEWRRYTGAYAEVAE